MKRPGWRRLLPRIVALPLAVALAACFGARPVGTPVPVGSPTPAPPAVLAERLAADGFAAISQNDRLWISERSGQFRLVAEAPTSGYFQDPAWHPDGEHLAYTLVFPRPAPTLGAAAPDVPYTSDIWQVGRDGAQQVVVRSDGGKTPVSQPVWSPEGGSLYYVRTTFFRNGAIAGLTHAIERITLVTGERVTLVEDAASPEVSPDGKLLAFVRMDQRGNADLWGERLVTGESRRLTDGRFASITSPRFSPSGQTIAFGGALFGRTAPRANAAQATLLARLGSWLATPASAHELLAGLWLIDADGSRLRPVGTFALDAPVVRWTSDPNRMLLYDEDGLYQVDLAHGQRSTVIHPGSYRGFDWLSAP